MAMLKLGPGIADINGRFGGDVFRYDQCGAHWQATPRHLRRDPSPSQRLRRRAWRMCHTWCRENMTALRAALWQEYANKQTHVNKKGETITLTYLQKFFKINIVRLVNSLEIMPDPPDD